MAQRRRGVRVIQRAAAPPRPRPVKRTTAVQRARAQQRERVSQGKAVEKQANRQRRAAARRQLQAPSRYYVSLGQSVEKQANQQRAQRKVQARKLAAENLGRIQPPTRGVYNPKDVALYAGLIDQRGLSQATKIFKTHKEMRDAASKAKALKVLDQLMRPGYASAGFSRSLVKGQSVGTALKHAKRGAHLKERYLYSDVLKEAGWKPKSGLGKAARGVAGFGLDVVADPTTYLTFGTTSVGLKGATRAAIKTGEAAARQETRKLAARAARGTMTRKEVKHQARVKGQEAARKSLDQAKREGRTAGPRGVTVSVAGGKHARKVARKLGVSSKRTAAPLTRASVGAGQAGRFLTTPLRGTKLEGKAKKAGEGARLMGSEVHAGVRAPDLTRRGQTTVKDVRREGRAGAEREQRRVVSRANALLGRLSEHEQDLVIDAIEADKVGRRLTGKAQRLKARKRRPIEAFRSRKTRRDPDRLRLIAEDLRSDLRYLNRTGRRSGLLAGQVGKQGRTREMVELSAKATPARSTAAARAKLKPALRDRALARSALKQAETPAQKKAAKAAVARAEQKVANLRKPIQREAEGTQARGRLRDIQQERFGAQGEARGFFPRTRAEDIEASKGTGILPRHEGPVREPGGTKAGAAERRQFRKSRAELRKGSPEERAVAESLSPDVRETLTRYGTSLTRASAQRELNTKLIQTGEKVPANLSKGAFEALQKSGKGIYRVRRGEVPEKITDFAQARRAGSHHAPVGQAPTTQGIVGGRKGAVATKGVQAKGQRRAVGGGGQYAVLDDAVVKHALHKTAPEKYAIGRGFDIAQGKFKTVALATPGYLVRNDIGDAFNAAVHENPFSLLRNAYKSQQALNALGRWEKANRIFERKLPQKLKTIPITPEQAAALGTTKREIPALQAAMIAEDNGVIRQGRFLELNEEGGRAKGTSVWKDMVKRAEDSVRMVTFMVSLQRGMLPKEAARNASMIHFDYSDLTDIEKKGLRRLMPFYTFTSRNLPLQAKGIVKHPGKYATVQKAREEGRKQAGLPVGFEKGQNPYEARQLGLPFRFGDRVFTLSAAAPFTDLNDIVGASTPLGAADTATKRVGEMMSPYIKTPFELVNNLSLFYRDQIQRENEPLTRAPDWAVLMSKAIPGFKKRVGMVDDYVPPEGGKVPGWGRKADYFFRQSLPGPITPLLDAASLGVEGKSARSMETWQRLLAAAGPRLIEHNPNTARVNEIYDKLDAIGKKKKLLMRRAHPTEKSESGGTVRINAEHPTPAFRRLAKRESDLSKELDDRLRVERPGGFVGGEEVPKKKVAKALKGEGGWGSKSSGGWGSGSSGWGK